MRGGRWPETILPRPHRPDYPGRPSRVGEALLHATAHLVQYLGMGRQVALRIVLDSEHACADRERDSFADILVERASGRGSAQVEHTFDSALDLLGRYGIAISLMPLLLERRNRH